MNALRNPKYTGIIWLLVRLWLGYEWISAGFEKLPDVGVHRLSALAGPFAEPFFHLSRKCDCDCHDCSRVKQWLAHTSWLYSRTSSRCQCGWLFRDLQRDDQRCRERSSA